MAKKTLQRQLKDLFADLGPTTAVPQTSTRAGESVAVVSAQATEPSAAATSSGAALTIKGQRDGVLVVLDEGHDWALQMAELEAALENNRNFFAGARMAVLVGRRLLGMGDIQVLQAKLAQRDVTLWALLSESSATQAAARHLNLATETTAEPVAHNEPQPRQPQMDTSSLISDIDEKGWMLRRTLRSGQKAHCPGHLTIIGDVNPGAEVLAGGNIVVWGRLHGLVHAGAMGDDGAVVCALDLAPTQLRIGHHMARSPEDRRRRRVQPEMASVVEGQIVAEPWDIKKRRNK